MISLSLNELKLVAKSRGIKHYESKSEYELIKMLRKPKPKIFVTKQRTKEVRKNLINQEIF